MEFKRIEDFGKLPSRDRAGHKGDFGRVLVVGGSRRMIGAPALAGKGALRGGAGLVTIASPAPVQLAVAMLCECATSVPLPSEKTGKQELSAEAVGKFRTIAEACDILAVGPGMAVGPGQEALVRAAIDQEKPLILDADGLNNLAKIDDWPSLRRCPLILTPHPGEFARLTGLTIDEIQNDRENSAQTALAKWQETTHTALQLILVLKGANTVVTDGLAGYVNKTGNPGMATGGSGDVLTGLIAGIALQGLDLLTSACLAVYVHGQAGDLAATEGTEESLIASDLLDYIPQAMQEIVA